MAAITDMVNAIASEANESLNYLKSIGMDENYKERMEELEEDKAAREQEWCDDMMQYERAGLCPEEQSLIPKLDQFNNVSYKYLRDHGNDWQYDPEEPHPKLKNRLYRRFDTFDKDSDGIMTITEVLYWADRMKTLCQANEDDIEKVRDALRAFFKACGLKTVCIVKIGWKPTKHLLKPKEKEENKGTLHLLLG